MKNWIFRTIVLICIIATMVFIFNNSAMDGEKSSSFSQTISGEVAEIIVDDFDELPENEQQSVINKINAPLREIAHGLEFAMLGFFLALFFLSFEWKFLFQSLAVIGTGILYAFTDEWHQTFVQSRAFELFDIGMDSIGCLLGGLFGLLIFAIIKQIIKKRRKDKVK